MRGARLRVSFLPFGGSGRAKRRVCFVGRSVSCAVPLPCILCIPGLLGRMIGKNDKAKKLTL